MCYLSIDININEAGPSRIRPTTSARRRRQRSSSNAPKVEEQEEHVEDVEPESVEPEKAALELIGLFTGGPDDISILRVLKHMERPIYGIER